MTKRYRKSKLNIYEIKLLKLIRELWANIEDGTIEKNFFELGSKVRTELDGSRTELDNS